MRVITSASLLLKINALCLIIGFVFGLWAAISLRLPENSTPPPTTAASSGLS